MDNAILFLFASVLLIGVGLLVIIALTKRSPQLLDKAQYQQQWLSIQQSVKNDPASMQFAIMQADKLLDKALMQRGFAGETMGERLKTACEGKKISDTRGVWLAHKLRNRIAHEHDVSVNRTATVKALQNFKRALHDLGAL